MMGDEKFQAWQSLLQIWNAPVDLVSSSWDDLMRRYSERERHYHTLDHVWNVFQTVADLAPFAANPPAVRLAAWLHDFIYVGGGSDNEERSADYALELCARLQIPEGRAVADLILTTKTHTPGNDADAMVLLDADLAILGASETEYQIYATQIRREYAWVPEAEYRAGRGKVLEKFLARERIFHFLTHLESAARDNLAGEIRQLRNS